jgi:hypothetical protein
MRDPPKLLHLSLKDLGFLVQVTFLLGIIRFGLMILPFQTVRRGLARFEKKHPPREAKRDPDNERRIVWAVLVIGDYIAWLRPCLTQSLAVQSLLWQTGEASQVHIGFTRDKTGKFRGHAWVEQNGQILIGGSESELKRFTPILEI